METLLLPYEEGTSQLSPTAEGQLKRFAADYLDHGSGSIAVSASRRNPNAPGLLAQRLMAMGVPGNKILVGSADGAANGDDVKLTYIRYEANTEACGDWSTSLADVSSNKPSPNLGCSTQHNLAAQIADPRDLVNPRPLEEDDAQRRLIVLQKYRKGETTVATKSQAQSGAVSDVAASSGGM